MLQTIPSGCSVIFSRLQHSASVEISVEPNGNPSQTSICSVGGVVQNPPGMLSRQPRKGIVIFVYENSVPLDLQRPVRVTVTPKLTSVEALCKELSDSFRKYDLFGRLLGLEKLFFLDGSRLHSLHLLVPGSCLIGTLKEESLCIRGSHQDIRNCMLDALRQIRPSGSISHAPTGEMITLQPQEEEKHCFPASRFSYALSRNSNDISNVPFYPVRRVASAGYTARGFHPQSYASRTISFYESGIPLEAQEGRSISLTSRVIHIDQLLRKANEVFGWDRTDILSDRALKLLFPDGRALKSVSQLSDGDSLIVCRGNSSSIRQGVKGSN